MATRTYRVAILAEGLFTPLTAKTATGVIRYSAHKIVAVIDSTRAGKTVRQALGFGDDTPIVSSIDEALQFNPEVLLIGIAPTGGEMPEEWRPCLVAALENGLEIWSGLHFFIQKDPELATLAAKRGARIWDVRRPCGELSVARGKALKAKAFIALMVGTDCNVGKMTVALELRRAAREKGWRGEFVATGQTGILIEGEGTPLDAVPGDFMSGEVEKYVMQHEEAGADAIFVEGQGALLHPGFGPVTLALILGCMPDAFVLCHQVSRINFRPGYDIAVPSLTETRRHHESLMQYYKAPKVVGVALNTYDVDDEAAQKAIEAAAKETGLPATDAIRTGIEPLYEAIDPLIRAKRGHTR